MTIEQEIDDLLKDILLLNKIGVHKDARKAFSALLNHGAFAKIEVLKEAFDSFEAGVLRKDKIEMYQRIISLRKTNDKNRSDE